MSMLFVKVVKEEHLYIMLQRKDLIIQSLYFFYMEPMPLSRTGRIKLHLMLLGKMAIIMLFDRLRAVFATLLVQYAKNLDQDCLMYQLHNHHQHQHWVVVVPRSPHNPPRPQKLELVIYSTAQDAEPRKIISLRRSKIKAPRFDQPSPALTIFDKQTKNRYKFSSITYDDKQQLRRLYNACKGISQVMPASAQMMIPETINSSPLHTTSSHITSPAWTTPRIFSPPMTPNNNNNNNIWVHESPRSKLNSAPNRSPTAAAAVSSPVPSAPPINTTSINTPVSDESADFTVCVVCWEAPVEGACIPCGHVSTCMSCLKKIKDNNGVCPVCRGEIDQVVKLYGI
ncbi:putative E3 ubiquitin-protein ligase XBAT35 isoform X3 [Spinacia oleracea]|uniref:E3 ubiquitin-protein ligase XBAT35 isoform X3 n=1 Tax=Spinacia oleracea TaxID=3562 RepID=A0ABM3QM76_SPIOL|nr:putative E3 ubiquitin-protein ligase XBAT35 isoform X3 [Spinacia oleracea]